MNSRIIIVNRFFHPDLAPTAQLLSDVAFHLREAGMQVHAITGRQRYDDPSTLFPRAEEARGVHIHRVATTRLGRHGLWGRAIDFLSFYATATWRMLLLARRGDIMIVTTDPPLMSLPASLVASLRGVRLVNSLQDLYPEVAQAAGLGGAIGKRLFPLLKRLRNLSLKKAATNVVLGDGMASRLRSEGLNDEKIRIIPNWQDGSLLKPVPHAANALREKWGLKDRFVVGYSGNLGRLHDVNTILDAIRRLHVRAASDAAARRVLFLFIGGGALHAQLQEEIRRHGLSNVMVKPYQPRRILAQSLSAADVHLISLRPEFEGLAVPSKFYGVLAVGRPTIFIGGARGEIPRILARHGCGMAIEVGDGEKLAKAILTLAEDAESCRRMGHKARTLFMAEYDKPHAMRRWEELIREVAN